jgi:hypothetical protein
MAGKSPMTGGVASPPRWAEFLLERLLAPEDAQTITGDLREEYAETVLPGLRRFRADVWYLRQAASLAPQFIFERGPMRRTLLLLSVFVFLCGCWLAAMESILRHPGYLGRVALDAFIAAIALLTILARLLHVGIRAEKWLWAGAVALIAIAVQAFVHNIRAEHFEGFVVVISLALVLQGIAMFLSLGRPPHDPHSGNVRAGQAT